VKELRIGISGWQYKPWRGVFYPTGLAQRRELEYASRQLNSVELNGSFYSLQTPGSYEKWATQTPDDFLFAIKGSRYITHMKKLKDIRIPLANFFASGMLALGKKLGPILWQFPPWWPYDHKRLAAFIKLLPKTSQQAAKLAGENTLDPGRTFITAQGRKRLQYAFEPRHLSFFSDDFIELLRKHNMALAFADTAKKFPYYEDVTADLVYIRLHGSEELYASGYSDEELSWWAKRIEKWRDGKEPRDAKLAAHRSAIHPKRDVYVYFDNDIKVHAPFDAINLAKRLGVSTG
jgi:uncharacterized protein YecE (DUF72 family)